MRSKNGANTEAGNTPAVNNGTVHHVLRNEHEVTR